MVFGARKGIEHTAWITLEQLQPALEALPSIHRGIFGLGGNVLRYVRQFVA